MLDELNAQDMVASMMEDNEVMDQLEEIGRDQRVKMGESVDEEEKKQPVQEESEIMMNTPAVRNDGDNLLNLLEDSIDEGMVNGAEQSFDFNPP